DDPKQIMPPPSSGKTLTAEQKELLRKWIASGAEYQSHWAFIPVPEQVPVPMPADEAGWQRNPIHTFGPERLNHLKTEPAAPAQQEKWLGRASSDLPGLPPALDELDSFLADQSPGAYEAAADRLLASPTFGERLANDWLDVARYADTFGYQSDRDMHIWP